MVANVNQMFYVAEGGVPWHKLGIPVEEAPNSVRALELAGLNYGIQKTPLITVIGDAFVEVPDQYALSPYGNDYDPAKPPIFGIVSGDYQVVDNRGAFDIVDQVLEAAGIEPVYETAIKLGDGERVAILARLREGRVVGKTLRGDDDLLNHYLLLTTGHNGEWALEILPTNVRVVCQNTVNLALALSHPLHARIIHTGDVEGEVERMQRALVKDIAMFEEFDQAAEALAQVQASKEAHDEFLNFLLPEPELTKDADGNVTRDAAAKRRNWEKNRERFAYVEQAETQSFWGLFNTATGFQDHQRMFAPGIGSDRRFNSLTTGAGAVFKAEAFQKARELAGVTS